MRDCKYSQLHDPTAFGQQERNQTTAPAYTDTDLAVLKSFAIPKLESAKFTVGAQFFNLFNHPNFASPSSDYDSPATYQLARRIYHLNGQHTDQHPGLWPGWRCITSIDSNQGCVRVLRKAQQFIKRRKPSGFLLFRCAIQSLAKKEQTAFGACSFLYFPAQRDQPKTAAGRKISIRLRSNRNSRSMVQFDVTAARCQGSRRQRDIFQTAARSHGFFWGAHIIDRLTRFPS